MRLSAPLWRATGRGSLPSTWSITVQLRSGFAPKPPLANNDREGAKTRLSRTATPVGGKPRRDDCFRRYGAVEYWLLERVLLPHCRPSSSRQWMPADYSTMSSLVLLTKP